jgi:hypothetical protein
MSGRPATELPPSSALPTTLESPYLVAVVSPDSTRVLARTKPNGNWRLYRAPAGVKVTPVLNVLLGLQMNGAKVPEVAVFSPETGEWSARALDPPAEGEVTPVVGDREVVYVVGRRLYAFGAPAQGWDALTLSGRGRPAPIQTPFGQGYQDGQAIHVFNAAKGVWERVDWESLEKSALESRPELLPNPGSSRRR